MRTRSLCIAAPLFALLAACGGGSDGGEDAAPEEETTTTTIPTLEADQVDAEASPWCATWAEIRAAGGPELTGDAEADADVYKEHYGELLPLVEQLAADSDDEVADAVDKALSATQAVAESGDGAAFELPDVVEAQQVLAGYAQETCSAEG